MFKDVYNFYVVTVKHIGTFDQPTDTLTNLEKFPVLSRSMHLVTM